MKKVYQYEYDNHLKTIEQLEKQLAEVRKYKGKVAIYQGDNWHDNPILYQTELKENALMIQIKKLKDELYSLEIIKDRNSQMIPIEEIFNPNLVADMDISEEEKKQLREKQNLVIKYPVNDNLFVDISSESGLEEILLYRIAYLICSLNNELDSKEILLINPDELYSESISNKISHFITESVNQKTIIELASEYINEKISLYKEDEKIEKFKLSTKYKCLIDKFIKMYLDNGIVTDDIKIEEEILFDKNEIKEALFHGASLIPDYDWACMYFLHKYKSNFDFLSDKITKKYADVYRKLPFDDPVRKEYVLKSNEISKIFKEKGSKIIKDYFKKLNKKTICIYKLFIENLNLLLNDNDNKITNFQDETLKLLKKSKVSISDITALIYIKYVLTHNVISNKHVILNDFQNYGEFMINTLVNVFPNAGITVFGKNIEETIDCNDFDKIYLNQNNLDKLQNVSETVSKVKKISK